MQTWQLDEGRGRSPKNDPPNLGEPYVLKSAALRRKDEGSPKSPASAPDRRMKKEQAKEEQANQGVEEFV